MKISYFLHWICNGSWQGGAAVLVSSSFPINFPFEFTFRIPDGLSVYYSEAFAILQALNIVKKYNLMKTLIISDASMVIHDIKYRDVEKPPHPHILNQICNNIDQCKMLQYCGFLDT